MVMTYGEDERCDALCDLTSELDEAVWYNIDFENQTFRESKAQVIRLAKAYLKNVQAVGKA